MSQALTFDPATHTYRLGSLVLPSVTEILGAVGVRNSFAGVDPDVLERKRQLGHAVHAAAHYDDDGELEVGSLHPEVLDYLEGWRAFRADYGFLPAVLETALHDPRQLVGGTLDRAGVFNKFPGVSPDELHVVDLKCGDPNDAAAQWQIPAYASMLADSLGRADILTRPTYAVQLFPHDYKVHRYPNTLRSYREFCAFVTTFRCHYDRRPRR